VSLETAIYIGVGISIILFLRRARQIVVHKLLLDGDRFREAQFSEPDQQLAAIRVLHVEGSLFFGAASELADAIDDAIADPAVKVLIVRLKRTHGLDYTTATALDAAHTRMVNEGRHMLLVGLLPEAMKLLERVGVADHFGRENLYPTRKRWFDAMDAALADAMERVGEVEGRAALEAYLRARRNQFEEAAV